jgi:dihydrofolate reductase
MKNIVVAYDREYAIGGNGTLPWAGKLPADMQHFRELTVGNAVIMGRATFESLPEAYRPLPGRQNIVLSLGEFAVIDGFQVARSLDEAYALTESDETFVVGGGQVYAQAIQNADRIYATEINTIASGVDTYFPTRTKGAWTEAERMSFI